MEIPARRWVTLAITNAELTNSYNVCQRARQQNGGTKGTAIGLRQARGTHNGRVLVCSKWSVVSGGDSPRMIWARSDSAQQDLPAAPGNPVRECQVLRRFHLDWRSAGPMFWIYRAWLASAALLVGQPQSNHNALDGTKYSAVFGTVEPYPRKLVHDLHNSAHYK